MKIVFLFSLLCYCVFVQAQVGIGTTTPSTNSALDVTSPNKGIMLPRLADTTNVSSPSAGLMIYDIQAKAPAYHDGVKWNNIASRSAMTSNNDSITYTITNPVRMGLFASGTFPLQSVYISGSQQSNGPNFTLSFSKVKDVNSIAFAKSFASNMSLATMIIEIKVYEPGATDPYYSYKLTGPKLLAYSTGISIADMLLVESFSIDALVFGFKNWTNGTSFGWQVLPAPGVAVAY